MICLITKTKTADRFIATILVLTALLCTTPLHAENFALQSADGALFMQLWPEGGCTVEAQAKRIRPTENPGVYWLDSRLMQINLTPQSHFCSPTPCPDTTATGILKTHRDWELAYWRQSLQVETLSLVDSGLVALVGNEWLRWSFAMPKSDPDNNVEKQLMLSTLVEDHVLVLGAPLWQATAELGTWAYLESVAATLAMRHGPVDIAAVQDSLRGQVPYVAAPGKPASGAVVQIEQCGLQFQLPSSQWAFREKMERGPLVMHLYSREALTDSLNRAVRPGITVACEKARPEWNIATYSAFVRKRNRVQGIVERVLTRKNSGLELPDALGYQVRWMDNAENEHTSYVVHALAGGIGIQFIADISTQLYETMRPEWESALRTLAVESDR